MMLKPHTLIAIAKRKLVASYAKGNAKSNSKHCEQGYKEMRIRRCTTHGIFFVFESELGLRHSLIIPSKIFSNTLNPILARKTIAIATKTQKSLKPMWWFEDPDAFSWVFFKII